jgi:hypothetical protein
VQWYLYSKYLECSCCVIWQCHGLHCEEVPSCFLQGLHYTTFLPAVCRIQFVHMMVNTCFCHFYYSYHSAAASNMKTFVLHIMEKVEWTNSKPLINQILTYIFLFQNNSHSFSFQEEIAILKKVIPSFYFNL